MKLVHKIVLPIVTILACISIEAVAAPPLPYRIGGTVTLDGVAMTPETAAGLVVKVAAKSTGTVYLGINELQAQSTGLGSAGQYIVDIPLYDATDCPGGANPGDTAVLHVYKDGIEYDVNSPTDGEIVVGASATAAIHDLTATGSPSTGSLCVGITPSEAVADGAAWSVDSGSWLSRGETAAGLSVGPHTVSFKYADNWITPAIQTVSVSAATLATASGEYDPKTIDLTMAASPSAGGSTTPTGTSIVVKNASTEIAATAAAGYTFVKWTASPAVNAVFANAKSAGTTVTLTNDATVTASFSMSTPPIANDQSVIAKMNIIKSIELTGTDMVMTDDNALTYAVVSQPAHGTLREETDPSFPYRYYTSTPGFTGTDSFTFKVNDGILDSLPATVSITVCPSGTFEDFTYIDMGTTIAIDDYTGAGGAVTIPNTIVGKPVTAIGEYAFSECVGLASVIIPDGVTSIGHGAFYECIGLVSASVPDSVTSIGDSAFRECPALTSFTIPANLSSIGNYIFSGCTVLASVAIPGGVTTIGEGAFEKCPGLTSITIPDGVTSIGNSAFEECRGLKSITVPNSVITIGNSAFRECRGLTGVTIGNGVVSIGDLAFFYCIGLTSVTIPDSVTAIGNGAFYMCFYLNTVTLGKGVVTIGTNAFASCSLLAAFKVDAANSNYTSLAGVLFNKSKDKLIFYPNAKSGKYTIPGSVATIGEYAFFGCSLTSVTIPGSVTTIEASAFEYCNDLTNLTIPDSVATIGAYAFSHCAGLARVTIPDSVTSLGAGAFTNCTGLTSVTIGDGVIAIEEETFYECAGLIDITIGSGVTSIGDEAFYYCAELTSAYFKGDCPTVAESAFYEDTLMIAYYLSTSSGWETTFCGRPTALWTETFTFVTLGRIIQINDTDAGLSTFTRKPAIYATSANPPRKVPLKVLTPVSAKSPQPAIEAEWRTNILLYDKEAFATAYKLGQPFASFKSNQLEKLELDLHLKTTENNQQLDLAVPMPLTLVPPDITSTPPIAINAGGSVPISGKWFGKKAPTAWLEMQAVPGGPIKKVACKVAKQAVYMDPDTGDSSMTVLLPAKWPKDWTPGDHDLIISNGVGMDCMTLTFP